MLWIFTINGTFEPSWPLIFCATILGSAGTVGMSVSAMTFAMRFAATGDQAGTDMTAVQSSRDLGETVTSTLAMAIAAAGYSGSFTILAIVALVTLGTSILVVRSDRKCKETDSAD